MNKDEQKYCSLRKYQCQQGSVCGYLAGLMELRGILQQRLLASMEINFEQLGWNNMNERMNKQ